MRLVYILTFLLIGVRCVFAQEDKGQEVWVKIIARDNTDGKTIENAQIVSYETMQMFATDSSGVFRGVFNTSDSLKIFGLGYEAIVVKVKKFENLPEGKEISLDRRIYMIRSVDVAAKKELHLHLPGDIKLAKKDEKKEPVALTSSHYSPKRTVLTSVLNPVGFVRHHVSKKERFLRKANERLADAKEQQEVDKIYNRNVIKEISGYAEGDTLTRFIVYCNVNINVKPSDNPLMVKQKILELQKQFETQQSEK